VQWLPLPLCTIPIHAKHEQSGEPKEASLLQNAEGFSGAAKTVPTQEIYFCMQIGCV